MRRRKTWTTILLGLGLLSSTPAVLAVEKLTDIYRLAEARDPDLAAQISALGAVREFLPQAKAQAFRPVISGRAGIDYNYQDTETFGDGAFGSGRDYNDFDGRTWALSIVQPVFHYDRWQRLKQVDSEIRRQELVVDATRQALIVKTAERYFGVLGAIDNLEFARAEKNSLQRQLDQTRQRFEVGLIAITDVQEAQAAYDLAVAQEIEAVNLLEQAREALREVTGEYHTDLALLGDELPLIKPEPENIDIWTETALKQNLDLAAVLAGAETAQQEIARQRAGHWPSIDAYGNVGYDRTGGRFGQADTYSDQIGIQMNIPIYEGGQVVSRTREAEFRYQESLDRVEETRRAVQRLTRDAYTGILSGISRVEALRQAVISAQTALEATQAGFDVGTRTTVDVVAAERDLYSAKRDYARSRYDYILDQYRLRQAAGTLSPEDLARMEVWLTERESEQASR